MIIPTIFQENLRTLDFFLCNLCIMLYILSNGCKMIKLHQIHTISLHKCLIYVYIKVYHSSSYKINVLTFKTLYVIFAKIKFGLYHTYIYRCILHTKIQRNLTYALLQLVIFFCISLA